MSPAVVVMGTVGPDGEALREILGAVPRPFPLPIAIVIDPRARTGLNGGGLSACDVLDKQRMAPDRLHVAPPDYHLLLDDDGRLALSTEARVSSARPSIDVLFQSAAAQHRERVVGILLGGGSQDGVAGLDAIARCGGVALTDGGRRPVGVPHTTRGGVDDELAGRHPGVHCVSIAAIVSFLVALGQRLENTR